MNTRHLLIISAVPGFHPRLEREDNNAPIVKSAPLNLYADLVVEPELPVGVWKSLGGGYRATCRSCDRSYEIELEGFNLETSYCGGSPRCLP